MKVPKWRLKKKRKVFYGRIKEASDKSPIIIY